MPNLLNYDDSLNWHRCDVNIVKQPALYLDMFYKTYVVRRVLVLCNVYSFAYSYCTLYMRLMNIYAKRFSSGMKTYRYTLVAKFTTKYRSVGFVGDLKSRSGVGVWLCCDKHVYKSVSNAIKHAFMRLKVFLARRLCKRGVAQFRLNIEQKLIF